MEWLCVLGSCLRFHLGRWQGEQGLTSTKGGGWGADPLLLDKCQAPFFLEGGAFFFLL